MQLLRTPARAGLNQSLPPGGRGTAIAVEGACVTLDLDQLQRNALSLSRLWRQLPPRGSLSHKCIFSLVLSYFLFIGIAFFEPRHYGGVFVLQLKGKPNWFSLSVHHLVS